MRKYRGLNFDEARYMIATITGQMADGTFVYTECDEDLNPIDQDKQYIRILRNGGQIFIRM